MSGPTKMIFITSNEDLIHRISSYKSSNTYIIDLDDNEQMSSLINDNNNNNHIIDLNSLIELNSNNNQKSRRILDSSDDKQVKILKKSNNDLICKICGDHAIGYNYDVLSCASCKAFFRRNVHLDLEELKCLTGENQCLIGHEINRKCYRCRLERCFTMGMRKDFIIKKVEINVNISSKHLTTSESVSNIKSSSQTLDEIDQLLLDLDENTDSSKIDELLVENLSIEDWITIENVRSLFLSIIQDDNANYFSLDISNTTSAVASWSQIAEQIALRYINFFRQIQEFEDLDADDRFILMKYNVHPLFPIYKCFNNKPLNNYLACDQNEESVRLRQFFTLLDGSDQVRNLLINLIYSLAELTEQDSILLSLLLIILTFSQGLSMNENEPILKDSLAVNRVQSHYTKLLWNYLVNKWGEIQASKYFVQLITMIFRIQSAGKIFRDAARIQWLTQDSVDSLTPLMQTVLHIS